MLSLLLLLCSVALYSKGGSVVVGVIIVGVEMIVGVEKIVGVEMIMGVGMGMKYDEIEGICMGAIGSI